MSPPRHRLYVVFAGWLALGVAGILPSPLRGQDPQYTFTVKPARTEVKNAIDLRPNKTTTVGVKIHNAGKNLTAATVKLYQGEKLIAQAAVKANEQELFFVKANGLKDTKDLKDAKDPKAKVEYASLPFNLTLKFQAGIDREPKPYPVEVAIEEPSKFLTVQPTTTKFDPEKKRLDFELELTKDVDKSGCDVQLVLGPGFKETKKGIFKRTLKEKGKTRLYAENIAFADQKAKVGEVYIHVNGYERAFTFTLSGDSLNLTREPPTDKIGIRVRAKEYGRPQKDFIVPLELDGQLPRGAQVELALLDQEKNTDDPLEKRTFPALHDERANLTIAESGELVFHSEVRDWKPAFDMDRGSNGPFWFRIRVLGAEKNPLPIVVPSRGIAPMEARVVSEVRRDEVFARVIIDDSPPSVAFIGLPVEMVRGKLLKVRAQVPERIDLAPVDRVVFFLNKRPADDKLPADIAEGRKIDITKLDPKKIDPKELDLKKLDPRMALWEGDLALPDKPGPVDITVQLTTRTGVLGYHTARFLLIDATKEPPKLAKIKGVVMYGLLPQVDLKVIMTDAKKVVRETRTNGQGQFEFDKVLPGTYLISASRSIPPVSAQAVVELKEGVPLIELVDTNKVGPKALYLKTK